jgi:general secretion pathway protein B
MSSILKALKKLEEQKAPRPQYELDLSSGIMRERKAGRHRRWVMPAGMAAVAIAAALATYAVMALHHQADTKENKTKVASAIGLSLPPQPATAPPSSPDSPAATSIENTAAVRTTVTGDSTSAATATTANSKPAILTTRQQPKSGKTPKPVPSAAIAEIPAASVASPPPPERTDTPASASRIPNLRLSGIAWQKDSANRYAVVNGMAVSQGSTIEGAKIEEILPDKVRFSIGSRNFEVPMGHISPTN